MPLKMFNVGETVSFEYNTFCLEKSNLLRPTGSASALTVDNTMARQI